MIIKEEQLYNITGGATSLSGTLINSMVRLVTIVLELGRVVGSAVRGKKC